MEFSQLGKIYEEKKMVQKWQKKRNNFTANAINMFLDWFY